MCATKGLGKHGLSSVYSTVIETPCSGKLWARNEGPFACPIRRPDRRVAVCEETTLREVLQNAVAAKSGIYTAGKPNITSQIDNLAERSKAVRSGRIPKGREFESHSCHIQTFCFFTVRVQRPGLRVKGAYLYADQFM